MLSALKTCVCTIALSFITLIAIAQQKDSTYVGAIEGMVKDSVHNYVLRSATVSVYKADNNQLLGYQLSNNFGKFQFKALPVAVKLNIMMSYVGYKPFKKEFVIPSDTRKLDLKTLIAERADNDLEEVQIVAKPPVEMKGDTLIFNADAFHLDSNATVEDLMRKLTGVTIWSDGLITVNGKKISNLYVEGKPFFGGDPKVAMQNLPKNVVDKIQVYEDESSADQLNPDVNVNIVLKKDKKSGLFGKIGAGYGTDQRYAADGMLSGYSPKTQLSIIGTRNNVNKTANSVQSLMSYSSYKGESTNYEYQSDFGRRGLNVFSSAGLTMAHEFNKVDRLNADYFFSNSKQDELEQVRTVESLNEGNRLERDAVGTSNSLRNDHRANSSYRHSSEKWDLEAAYKMNTGTSSSINTQRSDVLNTATGATSNNAARQENSGDHSNVEVDLKFENKNVYSNSPNKSAPFNASYNYKRNTNINHSRRVTDFTASDPSQNQYFNRQYDTDFDVSTHSLRFKMPGIQPLQLSYMGVNMYFENTVNIGNSSEATEVGELNTSGQYFKNEYLTNKIQYNTVSEKPVIGISKNYRKYLSNRYEKNLTFSLLSGAEVFYQENTSGETIQQFSESYFRFLPNAVINYRHQKTGDFYRTRHLALEVRRLSSLN
ncbi:MAG: TonB-dependent receptor [Pedobacter sp.]|nr:MAG: TonB-dependent receptor [Pedobacter sp.]